MSKAMPTKDIQVIEINDNSLEINSARTSSSDTSPIIMRSTRDPDVPPPLQNSTSQEAVFTPGFQQAPLSAPPAFTGILQLEPSNFKKFQKALKKYKGSSNMKKLSCLDYFAMYFTEICYFEVVDQALQGILGFGNVPLVVNIRGVPLSDKLLPSLFGVLAENKGFVGAVESLRAEDLTGLQNLGFQHTSFLGVFPVLYNKAITGLWVCTTNHPLNIPEKELQALQKLFTNLVL